MEPQHDFAMDMFVIGQRYAKEKVQEALDEVEVRLASGTIFMVDGDEKLRVISKLFPE